MGLKILRRKKSSSKQGAEGGAKSLPGGRPSDTSTITTRKTHQPYQNPIYQPTPYHPEEEVTILPPLGLLECNNSNNVTANANASTMSPDTSEGLNSFPIVNANEWPVAPSPPTPMNTPAQGASTLRHLHVDLRPATSYNHHHQQQQHPSYNDINNNVQQQPTNHHLQKISNLPPKTQRHTQGNSSSIDPMAKQFNDPPATSDPPGKKSSTPSLRAVMQREISKHRINANPTSQQHQGQQQSFLSRTNLHEGRSIVTTKSRSRSLDRRTTTNQGGGGGGGGGSRSVATSRSRSIGRTGGGGGLNNNGTFQGNMQKVGELPKRSKSPWSRSTNNGYDNRSQGGRSTGGKSGKNAAIAGGTAAAIGTLGLGGAASSSGGGRFTPRFLNRKSNKSYESSKSTNKKQQGQYGDFADPDTIVNVSDETDESVEDKSGIFNSCGPSFGAGYDEEDNGESTTKLEGGECGTTATVGGETAVTTTQYTVGGDEATYVTEIDNDHEDSVKARKYEKDDKSYASYDEEESYMSNLISYMSNTYESFDGDESYDDGESYDGTYLSQDYSRDDTARGGMNPPGNDTTWSSWFGLGGGGNKNGEGIREGGTTLTPEDDDESTRSTRSGASTVGTKDTEEDNNSKKKMMKKTTLNNSDTSSKATTVYDREGRPLPESRPMSRVSSFKQTLKKLKVAPHSPGKHGDDKSLATTASVSTKGSRKSTRSATGTNEGLNGDLDTRGLDVNDERQRDIYCGKHGDAENLIVRQYSDIPNVVEPDHVLVKIEASTVSSRDCVVRLVGDADDTPKPSVPGFHIVGTIQAIGVLVQPESFRKGDRIAALLPNGGGNAKYISIPKSSAMLLPDGATHEDIICLVANYITAYQCLKLSKKDGAPLTNANVLITGGSGPVGQALVELAVKEGAKVYATAHKMHEEHLTKLGARWFSVKPKRWLPYLEGKMDVVIDSLCVDGYESSYRALTSDGILICNTGDTSAELHNDPQSVCAGCDDSGMSAWWSTIKAKYFWSRAIFYDINESYENNPKMFHHELLYLIYQLQRGEIHPKVAGKVSLNQVPKAQKLIEKGLPNGTVVCLPWKKLDPKQKVRVEQISI